MSFLAAHNFCRCSTCWRHRAAWLLWRPSWRRCGGRPKRPRRARCARDGGSLLWCLCKSSGESPASSQGMLLAHHADRALCPLLSQLPLKVAEAVAAARADARVEIGRLEELLGQVRRGCCEGPSCHFSCILRICRCMPYSPPVHSSWLSAAARGGAAGDAPRAGGAAG